MEVASFLSVSRRRRDFKKLLSVSPCAEKFNIVSNDNGCTQKCDFSIFDHKHAFWANLVQKIKIASLS